MKIEQWPRFFPRHFLEQCIARQEVWGVEDDNVFLAIFRLIWSDVETWGMDDGKAGYIHTLAVHRRASGRNVGRAAIDLAHDEVIRNGRHLVRLDCVSHNQFLKRYYEGIGFTFVREATVNSTRLNLYEKER
jgi:ribosomal protein S18 acetylase RimI-like enzyme